MLVVEEADAATAGALVSPTADPDFRAGFPALADAVRGPPQLLGPAGPAEFRELRERITVRAAVEPFSPEEAKSYIAYRLEREDPAGSRAFSDGAIADVVRDGGGIPLRINALLDRARQPADALGTEIRQGGPRPDWSGETIDHGPGGCPPEGKASRRAALPRLRARSRRRSRSSSRYRRLRSSAPSASTGFGTRRFGLSVGVLVSLGGVLVAAAVAGPFYRIFPWSLASSRPHVGAAGQAANQPEAGPPQSSPVTTGAPLEAGARPTPPPKGSEPDALASANPSSGTGRRPATAPAETLGSQRLRRDFDAFLDRSGGDLALLTDAQRQALLRVCGTSSPARRGGPCATRLAVPSLGRGGQSGLARASGGDPLPRAFQNSGVGGQLAGGVPAAEIWGPPRPAP